MGGIISVPLASLRMDVILCVCVCVYVATVVLQPMRLKAARGIVGIDRFHRGGKDARVITVAMVRAHARTIFYPPPHPFSPPAVSSLFLELGYYTSTSIGSLDRGSYVHPCTTTLGRFSSRSNINHLHPSIRRCQTAAGLLDM